MADNLGPNNVYANIPPIDSNGRQQRPMFLQWNSDPVGNSAQKLSEVHPDLQAVVNRAQANNPNLKFVTALGKSTPAQEQQAKDWGWSQAGTLSHHINGNVVDLWPLDDQGHVTFDPGQQRQINAAMQSAAGELGQNIRWGGLQSEGGANKQFRDAPNFELLNPRPLTAQENAQQQAAWQKGGVANQSSSAATPGTTLNTSNVIDTLSRNIAQIESGGWKNPYEALGPNVPGRGQAIGKYQVMPENVPGWTQAALGHSLTPDQFRNDPNAQEAVFRDQMQRSLQLYSPKDAASIWFTGKPFSVAGGAATDKYTTNASYVARATAGLDDSGTFTPGAAVASASPTTPTTPGTTLTSLPAASSSGALPGFGTKQASDDFLSGLKKAGITPNQGQSGDQQPDIRPSPIMSGPGLRNASSPQSIGMQAAQLEPQLTGYSPGLYGQSLNSQPLAWSNAPIGPPAWLAKAGAQGAPQGLGTSLNSLQAMDPQMYADRMAMLYGTAGDFGGSGYG